MENKYTYDAFISYRHADLDKFVAENLHKQLEAFHLPTNVSKKKAKGTKTRINRIFRDKDELPIASDLASPIMTALQESEFLIVICSPRAPESQWVQREIDTFISLHGRDHVLAVLIEGEPQDSFPPALLEADKEITLEDGTTQIVKVPVEPLAADVRGKDKREVLKNIKGEILRLAAPMFNCGYDDLKQRHRERKIKRTLRIMTAACLFFILFGSFSTIQALRIQKQRNQIQKQSNQIQKQSDEISQQYNKILVTSLNQDADKAFLLLEKGDRVSAIQTALNALPKDDTDTQTPYVPHAEYALSSALHVYENNTDVVPYRILNHDVEVNFSKNSPWGTHIITSDLTNTLHIWKAASGEEIMTKYPDDTFAFKGLEKFYDFLNEDTLLFVDSNGCLNSYNFISDTFLWKYAIPMKTEYDFKSIQNMQINKDKTIVAIVDANNTLYLINATDGSLISSFCPENINEIEFSCFDCMAFSENNELLAFTIVSNSSEEGLNSVNILDFKKEKITTSIPIKNTKINDILFSNDELYIGSQTSYDFNSFEINEFLATKPTSNITKFNLFTNTNEWSVDIPYKAITSFTVSLDLDSCLIVKGSDSLICLNTNNGEILSETNLGSSLISVILVQNNTACLCVTRNGCFSSVDTKNGYNYGTFFEANTNNLKDAFFGTGYYAVLPYNDRNVFLYTQPENPLTISFAPHNDYFVNLYVDKKGENMISLSTDTPATVHAYDYPSGNLKYSITTDESTQYFGYAGKNENEIVLCYNDYIDFFDVETGNSIERVKLPDDYDMNFSFFKDDSTNTLYLFRYQSYLTIDLITHALSAPIIKEEFFTSADANAIIEINKHIWLANKTSGAIEEYDETLNTMLRSINANTGYISNLFFNESGDLLFVAYKNGVTEVYSTADLSLLMTYEDFVCIPEECITLTNGDYLLKGVSQAYLCSPSHEVKAYLPHCSAFSENDSMIISIEYKDLRATPLYTLDMLREEANRQLGVSKDTKEE